MYIVLSECTLSVLIRNGPIRNTSEICAILGTKGKNLIRFIEKLRSTYTKPHLWDLHSIDSYKNIVLFFLSYGPFILRPRFWKSVEKWFFKLGFFFLVNHFSRTRKNVDLRYKTIFFSGQPLFSNQISWTRFLAPLFSNHFSTTF